MSDILLSSAAALAAGLTLLWGVATVRRDVSIIDIFWGLGFVAVAWLAFTLAPTTTSRSALLVVLTTVWGLRLALYLLWRNWGAGEDPRYVAMRRAWGASFPWVSLLTVFGLQGVLLWFISLPLQVAMAEPGNVGWTIRDGLGVMAWAVGLGFETIGDLQLARFRADARNAGKVMDRGLWRYTRHPNYFGDALLWWGLFLIASATPLGGWTLLSPLLMNVLLLRVSGVSLLERQLKRTKPAYEEYVRRTSAFLPRPPRP